MEYSLSFDEESYNKLCGHLFVEPFREQAAFLLCRKSISEDEHRLLVKEMIFVTDEDIFESSEFHMKIKPQVYVRALKRANDEDFSFVFIHSHPNGVNDFSYQDDAEEEKLFKTAYNRIHGENIHASLIVTKGNLPVGRVWLPNLTNQRMSKIKVIGKHFRYSFNDIQASNLDIYDRQVRAFGEDSQHLIGQLKVGVVGVGGTGSSTYEQLVRLGIRDIVMADGDKFHKTNVNRVYGSALNDHGCPKVDIAERSINEKGFDVKIKKLDKPITFESVIQHFKNCDVIFACTDDEWGRSLLTRLSIYYHVPVIDMGVKINSEQGKIRSIEGRVTTLFPSTACLFCRNRINPRNVQFESLSVLDPQAAEILIKDGYAPELGVTAPSVIPFTTSIAAEALSEFIHRITQFMGVDRETTEVIHFFDQNRVRTNSRKLQEDCFCNDRDQLWGRGDVEPFMDMTWRPEEE